MGRDSAGHLPSVGGRRRLAGVFKVLRGKPDRSEREYMSLFPDRRASVHHHMGIEHHTIAELHFRPDRTERPDPAVFADLRLRRNDRCLVNEGSHFWSGF